MSVIIRKKMNRRGVSLLEILICVGILSIGLLGVAALIPAGHFAVVETTKADRSVACAKAAKTEVQLRGMLKPEEWRYYDGTVYDHAYVPGCTIILDPLGLATAIDDGNGANAASIQLNASTLPNYSHIYRLTTDNLRLSVPLSDLICHWADDTLIKIDDTNPDQRPRQIFASNHATDNSGPYPTIATDDTPIQGTLLTRKSQGDFSWFLTVTPNMTEVLHQANEIQNLDVSVAVCYKRIIDFSAAGGTIPLERRVYVDLDPTSFSGISGAGASDIPLAMPDSTTSINEYLEVKPGQWIMLVGQVQDDNINIMGGTIAPCRTIAKWYRILSVDDELDDKTRSGSRKDINFSNTVATEKGQIRWVTVTGPAWQPTEIPYNPATAQPGVIYNTQAVIVDSVIGVFTETMTVER